MRVADKKMNRSPRHLPNGYTEAKGKAKKCNMDVENAGKKTWDKGLADSSCEIEDYYTETGESIECCKSHVPYCYNPRPNRANVADYGSTAKNIGSTDITSSKDDCCFSPPHYRSRDRDTKTLGQVFKVTRYVGVWSVALTIFMLLHTEAAHGTGATYMQNDIGYEEFGLVRTKGAHGNGTAYMYSDERCPANLRLGSHLEQGSAGPRRHMPVRCTQKDGKKTMA